MPERGEVEFVPVTLDARPLTIEAKFVGLERTRADAPLIVFLHEGLGSISMWRDFPERLAQQGGYRALVYSRPGYGRSTPRDQAERWDVDFMHRQAQEVLPALLQGLGLAHERPWLFGHSDGGSIALLHAAAFPQRCSGVIALAPHLFVEQLSVQSIAATRETYLSTDLREKLGRHHEDVDSAFWGWNDIWLDPRFLEWNIEDEVARIARPVLAIQGEDDEYGTMAQIDAIERAMREGGAAGSCRLLKLGACGHSAHRDQPAAVIEASIGFISQHAGTQSTPTQTGDRR
ncbi:MAG TPA: alpha/beta hydrolase [Burkholderiaceae bacterium]|nr:alpha/beta hydrolase [Burkholderiaceae bacterium]